MDNAIGHGSTRTLTRTRTTSITRNSGSGGSTCSRSDHKVIGIQYTITALLFLLFGFTLMMIMRWQLAYPGSRFRSSATGSAQDRAPVGIMLPEFYNQLGAMHGTIMVFLGVVPLAVGGFGNFVMPLQIGAPDMAFPKLNMMSYWVYFCRRRDDARELLPAGRRGAVGLDVVSAARRSSRRGQTMWLIGMIFLITSSLLGSVNFIVTIVQLRRQGPDAGCGCRSSCGRSS